MAKKSNRFAPTPVLPDYYDDMLAQIMWNQEYPRWTSERKKINGEWVDVPISPEYQTSEDKRGGRMLASRYEDQKLAGLLGSSRDRRDGEKPGTYALANYGGLAAATDWARTGNMPGGSNTIGMWLKELNDPALRERNSRERTEWAAMQDKIVGRWG